MMIQPGIYKTGIEISMPVFLNAHSNDGFVLAVDFR
jgi:hypothetical protein